MPDGRDEERPTEEPGPQTGARASGSGEGTDSDGDDSSAGANDDAGATETTRESSDGDAGAGNGDDSGDAGSTGEDGPSSASGTTRKAAGSDAYAFERIARERLPPDVQYTPEFDDDWIYPSGAKAGGGREDVPVQGIELGVVAHVDHLATTVETVLDALTNYYERTGSYPRHRFVADEAAFERLTDGDVGVVATVQPRSDRYDGLVEHMQTLQNDPDEVALTPNRDAALRLAGHLVEALAADDSDQPIAVREQRTWERYRQVGDSPVIERYAPLAAEALYDPTAGTVDLDDPDADDVSEFAQSPAYLDVDDEGDLFERLESPDDSTGEEADPFERVDASHDATDGEVSDDATGGETTDDPTEESADDQETDPFERLDADDDPADDADDDSRD
jgi:hypothetical protein